jgi:hypothetical protein
MPHAMSTGHDSPSGNVTHQVDSDVAQSLAAKTHRCSTAACGASHAASSSHSPAGARGGAMDLKRGHGGYCLPACGCAVGCCAWRVYSGQGQGWVGHLVARILRRAAPSVRPSRYSACGPAGAVRRGHSLLRVRQNPALTKSCRSSYRSTMQPVCLPPRGQSALTGTGPFAPGPGCCGPALRGAKGTPRRRRTGRSSSSTHFRVRARCARCHSMRRCSFVRCASVCRCSFVRCPPVISESAQHDIRDSAI